MRNRWGIFVLTLSLNMTAFSAFADTFTVINTNDTGTGSLRQAITDANNHAGLDTIAFNIPGSGVHTITTPQGDLPTITDPVIIDGYTQAGSSPNTNPLTLGPGALGSNAVIQIELSGNGNGTGLNILAGNSTVRGIAVNRFAGNAINISNADGNVVEGNFIGTNPTGMVASANGVSGVRITSSRNNRIGGTSSASRNVISGNGADGVDIVLTSNNLVQGNLIGTDKSGTQALGNHDTAISLNVSAINNTIGGLAPGAGNVISANTSANGIGINSSSNGNLVQGNFIGSDITGTIALGNDNSGVAVSGTSLNNTIGGTAAGAGNLIAFNGLPANNRSGVDIIDNSTGNTVQGNSIFSNAALGINLGVGTDGVTLNDVGDADTGANNFQNYPILKSVTNTSGNVNLTGNLNSSANTTFRLEFFSNTKGDPSGFGEGETFLGFSNVTTDASGNATYNVSFPVPASARAFSATATDPSGNTSEFSPAFLTRLLNISTRMRVLTDEKVLIGGFIVAGTGPKKVIVRGIGPTLPVSGQLADPTLELHGAVTVSNDNWKDTQRTEIEATGIAPSNDAESAIVASLDPGPYTAILAGKNRTTGLGLVEVYDLDQSAGSKLANISTRGFVDTNDNVMIGGLILGPSTTGATKIMVRAIGPSLSDSGVQGPLQDPTLELHDGSGATIATNDNWKVSDLGGSQQAEIEATTLPPKDDRESALVRTLAPGPYTAIVRGKNNTTGVGLVEVYNLQ